MRAYPSQASRSAAPVGVRTTRLARSDLHDIGFLAGKGLVDLFDDLVGQVLHLGRKRMVLVLAHLVILLSLLQMFHAVAADIAHGDASLLGVFMRDFGDLVTALLVELGNGKAQELSFDHGIESKV